MAGRKADAPILGGATADFNEHESTALITEARRLSGRHPGAMARLCSTVDPNGCPLLMSLIKQQTPAMPESERRLLRTKMETLLILGANVNGQDLETGNTAAHLAVLQRDKQILDLLKRYRVDFSRANRKQQRPFQCDDGAFRTSVEESLKLDDYETTFQREVTKARDELLECSISDIESTIEMIAQRPFFCTGPSTDCSQETSAPQRPGHQGHDANSADDFREAARTERSRRSGRTMMADDMSQSDEEDIGDGRNRRRGRGSFGAQDAIITRPQRVHPAYLASIADSDGNSLLIAAVNQRLQAARIPVLLRLGADPNYSDHFGRTALHHVCVPQNQNVGTFSVLLHAGAFTHLRAIDDTKPRTVAAMLAAPHSIAHQPSQKALQAVLDCMLPITRVAGATEPRDADARSRSSSSSGSAVGRVKSSPAPSSLAGAVAGSFGSAVGGQRGMKPSFDVLLVAGRAALAEFVRAGDVDSATFALRGVMQACKPIQRLLGELTQPVLEDIPAPSSAPKTPLPKAKKPVEDASSRLAAPSESPEKLTVEIMVPLTRENEEVDSVEMGQAVRLTPAKGCTVKELVHQVAEQFNRQLWKGGTVRVSPMPNGLLQDATLLEPEMVVEQSPLLRTKGARAFLVLENDSSDSDSDSDDDWGDSSSEEDAQSNTAVDVVTSGAQIGAPSTPTSGGGSKDRDFAQGLGHYDRDPRGVPAESPLFKKPRLVRQESANGTAIDFFSSADIYVRSRDKEQKYLEDNALPHWWSLERVRFGLWQYKDSFAATYFDAEAKVYQDLGLTIMEPVVRGGDAEMDCEVCQEGLEENPEMEFVDHPICGHRVCKGCMVDYCSVNVKAKDFAYARCPCNCGEPLTESIIEACLEDDQMQKYRLWVARKYMESSQHMRECHASGCETFIEYHNDYSTQPILCAHCGNLWCWQCGKESHTPAACQQATKWFSEIGSDMQDKMLASKCKKCPKCRALINIDDKVACNHMTCFCGHHFCWLCMQPWSGHSGDFYTCNKFNEMAAKNDAKVTKARQEHAKAVEQRKFFEHCFDRYVAHDLAFTAATQHLPKRVAQCMARAKKQFDLSDYKLTFMTDCARELRLCRLALKWSYPYIYCMKEVEKTTFDVVVMKQAKLEKYTDLLHEAMAAVEIGPEGNVVGKSELVQIFSDFTSTQRRFNDFRTRIMEECKAINQFRLGLCETAQNNARKIRWDDVELGTAAKNYNSSGKWLDAQGRR